MAANDYSTFWLLFGKYGATMTVENLRDTYFPGAALKTMANKHSAGLLPPRTGDVYDVRDVAEWWDAQRKAKAS
ncbi:MAG: hypothetical protein J0I01_05895 [Stenotrophomonas nitritireducens]|uniref:hypothetical protein n=1 Tax=Stenotrophomonas nitritireducens TaxID=83617 RepID=UPI001AC99E6E|nr:hypothetical protein [Stenotrophomonas nitritireducens]MBN8791744.1 hypothetical protein [Stenotrophomonas nitritireducens]MBN8795682.1 hypothetical protein [Stenotrophomonas nitritireducens]